jgi:hypothetical protein
MGQALVFGQGVVCLEDASILPLGMLVIIQQGFLPRMRGAKGFTITSSVPIALLERGLAIGTSFPMKKTGADRKTARGKTGTQLG